MHRPSLQGSPIVCKPALIAVTETAVHRIETGLAVVEGHRDATVIGEHPFVGFIGALNPGSMEMSRTCLAVTGPLGEVPQEGSYVSSVSSTGPLRPVI
ncbi:hypothetical protein [Methanolobus chelungpuianus]|uniref:hypothetical protein n=1 Tax=Methanolobus chelungpuianus TaxID=502115 RepID=UPI002114F3D9|nr:hypothetical protein [Methanolobus chelungpuianus]